MKLIQQAILDGSFILDLKADNLESVFHQTLNVVIAQGKLRADMRDEVEQALIERERLAPTEIGDSVAVPHAYVEGFTEPAVVFIRLHRPLNLGAPDGVPTRFAFVLLGPPDGSAPHLDTLAGVARLMSDTEFRYEATIARNGEDLIAAMKGFRKRNPPTPVTASATIDESLQPEMPKGLFAGVMADIRRRWPHYGSDIKEGLNFKAVSSTLFLFFACVAPAITFGGLMASMTDNHIGAVEMLISSAFCGVIYALFAGQPLIILGGTGPLLIFAGILYQLCGDFELDFLAARAWVGIWTGVFLLILAVTNASALMRFFTRFTDEIFAALISVIFIVKALEGLKDTFVEVYEQPTESHDGALVPLLLALGTFYIAMSLSRFRRSKLLLPQMREFVADFGPSIALAIMIFVSVRWFDGVHFAKIEAPTTIKPTMDRAWLVDIFKVDSWVWLAASVPALLLTVLVFMDQNITARIVNSPDHKLTKGEAYHYDLALIGVLMIICSFFGLPWLVAATVRSLNHVRSLATLEEVVSRSGEAKERVIHVRETRLTGLAIHLLIGVSLLALSYLQYVPMAVLYGLFLYMGIVSISGNQFFERLSLWLMDRKLYPATHYTRQVPFWTIHKFTFIQLACLVVLWVVHDSPLGILFPLFVAMLVPMRLVLGRFMSAEHLHSLDADETPEEEETQWA